MDEHERLVSFYASLTDGELIKIGSQFESLTSDAQLALREEFDRRSLDAPELEEPPDAFDFQELVTIRAFRDPSDAMMAKSVLDSAGIPCLMKDENLVRMQWMWSNLIGGIRLQVRPEDAETAERLLSQEVLPAIELEDGNLFEQPRCPYCMSLDITFEAINQKVGFASILVAVPIPIPKNRWKCHACGREWKDSSQETSSDLE
jgi:hypothetical protein